MGSETGAASAERSSLPATTQWRPAFASHEWTLKRNCSMSPRQFASLFGSLAIVCVGVASIFAYSGAWWILVFAFIQIAALAAAFVVYARHAGDYERIVVTPEAVIIEFNSGTELVRQQAHPALARVEYPYPAHSAGPDSLIGLALGGEAVEVGRFVPRLKREGLAQEIRAQLLAARNACWK
jgi:uncharacterized membrane protein